MPRAIAAEWVHAPPPRAWVVGAAAALFSALVIAHIWVDDPDDPVLLYTLPIVVVALQLGIRAGLVAATAALGCYLAWVLIKHMELEAFAIGSRAATFALLAVVIGHLAQRLATVSRRNAALLDTMFDPFAVYVAVRRDDGRIEDFRCAYANDAACILTDTPREQLVGRTLRDTFPASEADGTLERYRGLVGTGVPLVAEQIAGAHVLDVRAVQLGDGFAAALRDITDRKHAEDRLVLTRAELERSNAALLEFAHIASHELSEPLATAALYAETLEYRAGDALDRSARRLVELLRETLGRMQDRITGMLSYAEVHHETRRAEAVNCAHVLDEVLAELQSSIAATDARVTVHPLPTIAGDAERLSLLFENLLSNALRFRRDAGRPEVSISAVPEGAAWHFQVSDHGPGIPLDDRERIFGLFERCNGVPEPGTGIGLAVCRSVVEEHGGRIWVESGVGRGSTFHFTLNAGA
jgi:signal transduction histidine kinase